MNLWAKLKARAEAGRPVRVALIGAGKFGSMFLAQAPRTPGLHVAAIADLGCIIFPSQLIPEWGSVAAAATEVIPTLFQYCATVVSGCVIPWWQILFPGIALFLFAISVNLLADGLRDALDPRLRR